MMRVFADKFTTVDDKNWFEDELNAALEKPAAPTGKEKKGAKGKEEKPVDIKELPHFFADFMRFATKDESGEDVTVVDMRMVPKVTSICYYYVE